MSSELVLRSQPLPTSALAAARPRTAGIAAISRAISTISLSL
jgi:hypothetical protein